MRGERRIPRGDYCWVRFEWGFLADERSLLWKMIHEGEGFDILLLALRRRVWKSSKWLRGCISALLGHPSLSLPLPPLPPPPQGSGEVGVGGHAFSAGEAEEMKSGAS